MTAFNEAMTQLVVVDVVSTVLFFITSRTKWIRGVLIALFTAGLLWFSNVFAELVSICFVPLAFSAAAVICLIRGTSVRTERLWIAGTSGLLFVGYLGWWMSIFHTVDLKLLQHPVISLVDRLDYESDVKKPADLNFVSIWMNQKSDSKIVWTDFESSLRQEGNRIDASRRNEIFASLLSAHQSVELQFAMAVGFGVERAYELPYQEWEIDLPDRPLFSLPAADRHLSQAEDSGVFSDPGVDYQPWHVQNLVDFVNPITWGLVEQNWNTKRPNLSRVVGFVPHAFAAVPSAPATLGDSYSPWRIDALSLVSLLKHRPAAAYVSDHLPNMNELKSVPTRPLDEFESGALEKLRDTEELVVAGTSLQLRMLGSIRAAYQCQECHQVPRGTLLGAFSYRLVRQTLEE